MKYTLIMKNGKVMQFYIQAMAELYQRINGGVIVTDEVLNTVEGVKSELLGA